MDELTREKWNRAAGTYDIMGARGAERRWAGYKRKFFSGMNGKVLFLAVGTGLDIQFFPSGQDILGIDISPKMLDQAGPRAVAYDGKLELRLCDVHDLGVPDDTFDQIYTSCTFCSVPNPIEALRVLRRVLKTGGRLRMFEHTGSRWFPFNAMLNLMTPLTRRFGPEVNRDTTGNVEKAGFHILRVENLYLDVVKTIEAEKR